MPKKAITYPSVTSIRDDVVKCRTLHNHRIAPGGNPSPRTPRLMRPCPQIHKESHTLPTLIPSAPGTDVNGTVIQGKPKAASKTPKTLQYGHKKRHFTRFSRLPTKTPKLNPPSSKKESLFRLKMHNSTTIFRPGAPHSGRRRLRTQLWDP